VHSIGLPLPPNFDGICDLLSKSWHIHKSKAIGGPVAKMQLEMHVELLFKF